MLINIDYVSRDQYLYNRLYDQMRRQNSALNHQHCIDTNMMRTGFYSTIARFHKSDNIKPIRIDMEGNFVMPVGEVLYQFQCVPKLLYSVKLRGSDCYKNLPVVVSSANGEHIKGSKLIYLEPRSRIIQHLGIAGSCSIYFQSHFKSDNGRHVVYTEKVIHQSTDKLTPFNSLKKWKCLMMRDNIFLKFLSTTIS